METGCLRKIAALAVRTRPAAGITALLALLLGGCDAPQSMLNPRGPAAGNIAPLGWFVFILFLVVIGVMWIMIAIIVSRRRGSFDEHEPYDAEGGHSFVLLGGFVVPAIILATIFIFSLSVLSAFPVHEGQMPHTPASIRVVGHQWWWEVHYVAGPVDETVTTANEIHIPSGIPVDIDLTSDDVIHSFFVPTLHGKVDLVPGVMNRIRIQANQPGTYSGECAEYCGAEHPYMRLLVIADTPENYEKWLAQQRQPAAQPVTDEQKSGEQVFRERPCGLCHTIRGTSAGGKLGPDLTHIGSRRMIAANILENNEANLSAWVTHAQSLKPAVKMPNITQFSGPELHQIVAYLRQLQ